MPMRSRFHAQREARGVNATTNFSGWNDSLSLTGVVPPHGFDFLNRAGVNVTAKTVLSIGVVQRCLEIIQNAHFVMGAPRPYTTKWDKDGFPYKRWIPATSDQYPTLLKQPWGTSPFADNAVIPYNIGCGKTIVSMGLFGEAWELITSRDDTQGYATSLEPLHPSFIDMRTDPNGTALQSIWYGMGAKRVELDPADLVHIPRMILPGDRSGLSPITNQSPIFAIAIAAVQYSQMWFAQGGQPSYILTSEQKLGQDQIDRIFEHILLEHSGMNNSYEPLILDSGVKPEMIQSDPDKSQMIETLQYVREEIAGYFGIPAHLVGSTGDSGNVWGKGIQEQNYSMDDFTLSGYRIPYEEAFSSIMPDGTGAAVDHRQILRANSVDNSKASLSRRTGAVTTPDEERRYEDLPPLGTPESQSITSPLNSNIPAPPDDAPPGGTDE
jgi:HK97 family phage portal protein